MNASIQMPGKNAPIANLHADGQWSSPAQRLADYLNALGKEVEAHNYLPDPFEDRLKHILRETGAILLSYTPPQSDADERTIF